MKQQAIYWIISLGIITLLAYFGSFFLSMIGITLFTWRKHQL